MPLLLHVRKRAGCVRNAASWKAVLKANHWQALGCCSALLGSYTPGRTGQKLHCSAYVIYSDQCWQLGALIEYSYAVSDVQGTHLALLLCSQRPAGVLGVVQGFGLRQRCAPCSRLLSSSQGSSSFLLAASTKLCMCVCQPCMHEDGLHESNSRGYLLLHSLHLCRSAREAGTHQAVEGQKVL